MAGGNGICPFISGPYIQASDADATEAHDIVYTHGVHLQPCLKTSCELWNASSGQCSMFSGASAEPPLAAKLISEFMSNEDKDGKNIPGVGYGAVYGRDFKIIENDDIPPMLKQIHQSHDFKKLSPSVELTWNEYLTC